MNPEKDKKITEEEIIDRAAEEILNTYRAAFEELAKLSGSHGKKQSSSIACSSGRPAARTACAMRDFF